MRVYINQDLKNPFLYNNQHHDQPFRWDPGFILVNNPQDADIIPVMRPQDEQPDSRIERRVELLNCDLSNKLILIMMHTHVSEIDQFDHWNETIIGPWRAWTDRVAIVDPNTANTDQIVYDFYFNRHKAYYCDYDRWDHTNRLWTGGAQKDVFELADIPLTKDLTKRFLSPNKIRPQETQIRDRYRTRIYREFNRDEDCWYSDWSRLDQGEVRFLEPQGTILYGNRRLIDAFAGWWPIANHYYDSSMVSVYTETLTMNSRSRLLSEKTLDPLIKGHFILPYGYPGLIEDIRSWGFQLPAWIDYGYDTEPDDEQRFQWFLRSAEKLRRKSLDELAAVYRRDRELLVHNREIFFTRDYDYLSRRIFQWMLNRV